MGEHKYDYKIELDEMHKQEIIKGLYKLLEEKAIGIKQVCADGRITGQVYDCETETLSVILNDIEKIRETLIIFRDLEKEGK